VQALAEEQDTPENTSVGPGGLGVVWVVQDVPFHRSARVTTSPELLRMLPTAVQALADVQDTPFRLVTVGPVWIVQVVPFHCSASVMTLPEGL